MVTPAVATPPPLSFAPGTRRRIWQVDASMHCSILGTCLTVQDLHVIARRAGRRLEPEMSAYDVHSWFVDAMACPNELSKLVDKTLAKRHESAARGILRATSLTDVEARWREVGARGHIAAAYWGAMSHPLCSKDFQWVVFGEIHMLSHLLGASRHADLCRVHELEAACVDLDAKLAQLKQDHRALLKERHRMAGELATRRREQDLAELRLVSARERLAALESATGVVELERRVVELERRLKDALARACSAETAFSDARTMLRRSSASAELAAARVRELTTENEALEMELMSVAVCPLEREPNRLGELGGLCGKRILCVGGRISLVPHYRALVERRGGELLHHDGGLEDSLDAVTRALVSVDAVVCPIDCVSHAACSKVKRACKNLAKPFIPLRTSGLSSFARCIRAMAQRKDATSAVRAAENDAGDA